MASNFTRLDRYGNVVGMLSGLMSAVRHQETDSDDNYGLRTGDRLTLTLTGELDEGDRVVWRDPRGRWWEWVCKVPDTQRASSVPVSTCTCVSSWEFDLGSRWIDSIRLNIKDASNKVVGVKDPKTVLKEVLDGTAWSVGTVDDAEPIEFYGSSTDDYTSYYHVDALTCVHRLCKYFALEAYPTVSVTTGGVTERRVNLVKRRGSAAPVWRFSYSRDLQDVRRTFSGTPVYTKLHVYGKGDPIMNELNVFTGAYDKKITFEELNNGKDYLEDDSLLANFGTLGPNGTILHTEGYHDFSQCEDKSQLLKWGKEYFEQQKTPDVSYTLGVTATNKAGVGYGGCDIGDTVQVVDTSFPEDLRLMARVIQIEEDLLDGAKTLSLTLGNAVRSITSNAAATASAVSDVQNSATAWNQAGSLGNGYLDKLRKQLNEEFLRNGTYHVTSFTLGDVWSSVEIDTDTGQPKNPTADGDKWAINISSKGFRIASKVNSDGTWDWTTFGTGEGFTADAIVGGTIDASVVKIKNLLAIGDESTVHAEVDSGGFSVKSDAGSFRFSAKEYTYDDGETTQIDSSITAPGVLTIRGGSITQLMDEREFAVQSSYGDSTDFVNAYVNVSANEWDDDESNAGASLQANSSYTDSDVEVSSTASLAVESKRVVSSKSATSQFRETFLYASGEPTSNTWSVASGALLWNGKDMGGSEGYYMSAGQSVTLKHPVSSCRSGIVLHWQEFNSSTNKPVNSNHVYTFVPKGHVAAYDGNGVDCALMSPWRMGFKYVYVSDTKVAGHADNMKSGTVGGVTVSNASWVLTQVIAV